MKGSSETTCSCCGKEPMWLFTVNGHEEIVCDAGARYLISAYGELGIEYSRRSLVRVTGIEPVA